jgi:hypothetical protein
MSKFSFRQGITIGGLIGGSFTSIFKNFYIDNYYILVPKNKNKDIYVD